jgi:TetR/AcrR family transcriptional regulator, ethionamide resistance regulator
LRPVRLTAAESAHTVAAAGEVERKVDAAMGAALCRLLADGTAFTEISVDQIVREAGIARSTFYVYFEDKAQLLRSLSEIAIAEILAAVTSWTSAPATLKRESLQCRVGEVVRAYVRHGTVMAAVMEISSYDRPAAMQFTHFLADAIAALEAHIRSGQAAGVLSPQIDAHRMAEWLVGMTERGLSRLPRVVTTATPEAIVTSLTAIIWNVLYRGHR